MDLQFERYKSLMKREVASGVHADSLFFGIHFGMTSKQFFAHCWEMNKKGLFTDGQSNTAVLYRLNNHELKHPASLNFYPSFTHNKISGMRATFEYDGWAPWNKHLWADSLLPDVLALYKKWYSTGNPFLTISDKERGTIYVKVDGNRRIIIGRYDDMLVKVDYTDLLTAKTEDGHATK
ncbi:hypothetical protein GCM10009415_27340 [Chitinophaga japonensis]